LAVSQALRHWVNCSGYSPFRRQYSAGPPRSCRHSQPPH
jgi:hypothetical protein